MGEGLWAGVCVALKAAARKGLHPAWMVTRPWLYRWNLFLVLASLFLSPSTTRVEHIELAGRAGVRCLGDEQ